MDPNKTKWRGSRLERIALFWHQSGQECFEMSHCQDTWVQYEEALYDHCISAEEKKGDLKRMSVLGYEGNFEDYITQKTYYTTHLDLKSLAWVAQIALGFPF
jgi:hypothetical protein